MTLIKAIEQNNQAEFDRLLKLQIDQSGKRIVDEIDTNPQYGGNALYWALAYGNYHGHLNFVRPLLKAGVDVNHVGNDGFTPLLIAAQQKLWQAIPVLLDAGANASVAKKGWGTGRGTVLEIVKEGEVPGYLEVVKLLEDHLEKYPHGIKTEINTNKEAVLSGKPNLQGEQNRIEVLRNSLISDEFENAMNLPSQAEIQAYARKQGIPLIIKSGQTHGHESQKSQKQLEKKVENEEVPEVPDNANPSALKFAVLQQPAASRSGASEQQASPDAVMLSQFIQTAKPSTKMNGSGLNVKDTQLTQEARARADTLDQEKKRAKIRARDALISALDAETAEILNRVTIAKEEEVAQRARDLAKAAEHEEARRAELNFAQEVARAQSALNEARARAAEYERPRGCTQFTQVAKPSPEVNVNDLKVQNTLIAQQEANRTANLAKAAECKWLSWSQKSQKSQEKLEIKVKNEGTSEMLSQFTQVAKPSPEVHMSDLKVQNTLTKEEVAKWAEKRAIKRHRGKHFFRG